MKAQILDIQGKKIKDIEMPKYFSSEIREDIVSKVLEAKKVQQPYSPSPVAGRQQNAAGKMIHARHVWRSGYGRGGSRTPRKIMSSRGSQFNWVGAEVPNTRGGRRAHPPKIIARMGALKVNKKEEKIAFISALSATANSKEVASRYERLKDKKLGNLPFIVESKITSLKTKEFLSSLKNILGELFEVALQKKTVRGGRGKMRGRKYKKNAGVLIVVGEKENFKRKGVDIQKTNVLSVTDLARGGPGRIAIYTEQAINELNKKFGDKK